MTQRSLQWNSHRSGFYIGNLHLCNIDRTEVRTQFPRRVLASCAPRTTPSLFNTFGVEKLPDLGITINVLLLCEHTVVASLDRIKLILNADFIQFVVQPDAV